MQVLSSAIRLGAGLLALAAGVLVFFLACLLLLPSRRARIVACNWFGKTVGRSMLWFIGAGVPAGGPARLQAAFPAIYVSNHSSIIDNFLGMWLSPVGTVGVAKKEIVYFPFLGLLYLVSGHLRVDRSDRASAAQDMARLAELVRRHRLGIWIWPEGTRSADGRLQPFKKGFVHLAVATGLPVVPVVVRGAYEGWRKNSLLIVPTDLRVDVLEPIPTTRWTLEDTDAHVEEVHRRFRAVLA